MGFIQEVKYILWGLKPFKRPGRIGELKDNRFVFCPIFNEWIDDTSHDEIAGERSFYYVPNEPDPKNLHPEAVYFHQAIKNSKYKFPEDVKKVVLICEYCHVHCYGQVESKNIPPLESIDRKELLSFL
jgi:hypothetical protein